MKTMEAPAGRPLSLLALPTHKLLVNHPSRLETPDTPPVKAPHKLDVPHLPKPQNPPKWVTPPQQPLHPAFRNITNCRIIISLDQLWNMDPDWHQDENLHILLRAATPAPGSSSSSQGPSYALCKLSAIIALFRLGLKDP